MALQTRITKKDEPESKPKNEDLFDHTIGYEEETAVRLAPGLSIEEERQARQLYSLFNGLWGLCLIFGDPGTGKDLFGNIIDLKCKMFFPWKQILRDEKPRELFGSYTGLFNETVLASELDNMREVAHGATSFAGKSNLMSKAADDWVTEKGAVLLKNSILYLTEYWNYCYKRNPMSPMNKTMGAIHKMKRHLDCLILGTCQQEEDLDRFTCLPFVDWRVTCTRSVINPTGFVYYVEKVAYDRRKMILVPTKKPVVLSYDGGKPRSYLGNGIITITKNWYQGETDDEQLVLGAIKAGVNRYEDLVTILEDQAGMTEAEVLTTLKDLKFRKTKRVITYPDFFGLYNSKSAPQIKSQGLQTE